MINWRTLPFVRLLVPLVSGIMAASFIPLHPSHGWIFLPLLLLLMHVVRHLKGRYSFRWVFGILLHFFFFITGYQAIRLADDRSDPLHFSQVPVEGPVVYAGVIQETPVKKGNWVRFRLRLMGHIDSTGSWQGCTGTILAYLQHDPAADSLQITDQVCFRGRPDPVPPPLNPHSFDYRRYLQFQHIHYQVFVREGDWSCLGQGRYGSWKRWLAGWKDRFQAVLRKHLPAVREFSVGSALILGERDDIPDDLRDAYSETGAMHVLAVSGLHVGIVFLIVHFLLKQVGRNDLIWRILKMCIQLAAIWLFALITGASPSVIRASVMFSFVNAGQAFQRHSSIFNTLAASAFFMLLWDPYLLFSVSFQLSYLALIGIVYFQPRLTRLWPIRHALLHRIWELICVSIAAQLMTFPLTLYYFHQFPTYFWLSSLLLVPLAGVELGTGLFLLLFDQIQPGGALTEVIGKVLNSLIWSGNEYVSMIRQFPGALTDGIWIESRVVFACYLALICGMLALESRQSKFVLSGLISILFMVVDSAFLKYRQQENQQLVVYHLNRGLAIDLFDGKTVHSWKNEAVDKKSFAYASEGHRMAMGMDKLIETGIGSKRGGIYPHSYFQNGFAGFYQIRLGVVSGPVRHLPDRKIEVDYLVISGNPKIGISSLLQAYTFDTLVIDATNQRWIIEKWKRECRETGLEVYDLREQGALVLNL